MPLGDLRDGIPQEVMEEGSFISREERSMPLLARVFVFGKEWAVALT